MAIWTRWFALGLCGAVAMSSAGAEPLKFDCVEVELFKVNRDEIKSKPDYP